MSTDRELLELAAKAAGVGGGWGEKIDYHNGEVDLTEYWVLSEEELFFWNPLTDDGDALRLAVSIPSMDLHWFVAKAWQACESEEDRRAYVRRSIVCAAAEIGRFLS